MKKLLLPIILVVLGGGGGIAAGYFLKQPAPAVAEAAEGGDDASHSNDDASEDSHASSDSSAGDHGGDDGHGGGDNSEDYVKLQNQFIVPIIHHGRMSSLALLGLAIETTSNKRDVIFKREPKLRAALLRVMFDHSNIGGFDGNFTENGPMEMLQENLLYATRAVIGSGVEAVHIIDIARQDLE